MKKTKADWLAAVDAVEKRMVKVRRPNCPVVLSRAEMRAALIDAYTSGRVDSIRGARRRRKVS